MIAIVAGLWWYGWIVYLLALIFEDPDDDMDVFGIGMVMAFAWLVGPPIAIVHYRGRSLAKKAKL